jgi:hypothetical protein
MSLTPRMTITQSAFYSAIGTGAILVSAAVGVLLGGVICYLGSV